MGNRNLISNYGFALKHGSTSGIIELSRYIKLDFNFQIHRIKDLVNEFKGQMPPSKFPQHVIAIIRQGVGDKQIGAVKFKIDKNVVLIIPCDTVHSSNNWDLNTDGYMLSFNNNFFEQSNFKTPFLKLSSLFKSSVIPYRRISEDETEELLSLFYLLEMEDKRDKQQYNRELLVVKVMDLLIRYLRIFDIQSIKSRKCMYDNFLDLLEKDFRKERSAGYYSQKLNIHANHLNRVVKKYSGNSVKSTIKNRVIIEAKYLLNTTNLTVKEISSQLGFSDQNSFSRYFKASEEISITDYRKQYV